MKRTMFSALHALDLKKVLTITLVLLLIVPIFSVLLPRVYAADLEEKVYAFLFESLELTSNSETPEVGSNLVPTYGVEPDLTRRSEPTTLSSDNELNSLTEQTLVLNWQKSTSVMATGTSTSVFYEDFEGAFPGLWSVGDSNPSGGSDYWDDTSYRAYGGSWSGWCADEGTQGGATTIFYEDFEGAWPGSWTIGDWDSDSGYDYWGDYYWKYHEGHWSGYCADIGSRPSGCGYDDDMEAYMYRSVSLSGYSSVALSYWYWTDIEDYWDKLYVLYKDGGTWYIFDKHTGNSAGWHFSSVNIPTTATHVGFYFLSDSSVCDYDGAFIDEVELEGTGETPNKSVHEYDNHMDSYLSRGSFDARNWDLAYVTFYAWIQTESSCDFITFDTSGSGSGGPWHELWSRSGSYKYWSQHAVRIPDNDLTSNLWVGFDFISDGSITYEGAYLDNIALKWYDVTLDNYNIDTTKVNPGDTFMLGYYIDNPTSYTIDVGLGATIRDPSNTEINDPTRDIVVSASPGAHWYYRQFRVPSWAEDGLYDVMWGIWSGTPGSSRWWGGSGWQNNILTVGIPDLTISVDGTTKPDLTSADPVAGEPIWIWFTLDNIGQGDATSTFTNYFYIDSNYEGQTTESGLDTDTAVLIHHETTQGPGYHTASAEADVFDNVDESDEGNNYDSKSIWWKSPDLVITDFWTNPSTLTENEPFTIHYTVKNNGDADAVGTFRARVNIDGTKYDEQDKNGLAQGNSYTWTFNHDGLPAGSHSFEVIVDINDDIKEANKATGSDIGTGESNNAATIHKDVQPGPEPDFAVSATPPSFSIAAGSSGTTTVNVDSLNGFNSPVSLDVIDLPIGISFSYDYPSITPPADGRATSILTLIVDSSVVPDTYYPKVTGTSSSPSIYHEFQIELTIGAPTEYTVSLDSRTTDGLNSIGAINFGSITYSLPSSVTKEVDTYVVLAITPGSYSFHHWEWNDGISISEEEKYSNPAHVTVAGNGELIAVYFIDLQIVFSTNEQYFPVRGLFFDDTDVTNNKVNYASHHALPDVDNDGKGDAPAYVYRTTDATYTVLEYWLYYAYDNKFIEFGPYKDPSLQHEHDFESFYLWLDSSYNIVRVSLNQHHWANRYETIFFGAQTIYIGVEEGGHGMILLQPQGGGIYDKVQPSNAWGGMPGFSGTFDENKGSRRASLVPWTIYEGPSINGFGDTSVLRKSSLDLFTPDPISDTAHVDFDYLVRIFTLDGIPIITNLLQSWDTAVLIKSGSPFTLGPISTSALRRLYLKFYLRAPWLRPEFNDPSKQWRKLDYWTWMSKKIFVGAVNWATLIYNVVSGSAKTLAAQLVKRGLQVGKAGAIGVGLANFLGLICDPINGSITDEFGNTLGIKNSRLTNEIAGGFVLVQRDDIAVYAILFPSNASVGINATTSGNYTILSSVALADNSTVSFEALEIEINPGSIHEFAFNWIALGDDEEGVEAKIDQDGDGLFEQVIQTGATLTNDQVSAGYAYTDKSQYEVGADITLGFNNTGSTTITLPNTEPWVILNDTMDIVYHAIGAMIPDTINPGETREWMWNQENDIGQQVPPGAYYFQVETSAGIFTSGFSIMDVTPPTIQIISPQSTTYATRNVELIFTIDEPTSWIGYSLDGQTNVTIAGNTILTSLGEGSHNIIVYANDTYGNMGFSSIVYFTIDTIPPTTDISLSGTLGLDEWYVSDVTVTLTATDEVSGVAATAYSFDAITWISYLGPFTITNEGTTIIYFNSTDNVGNTEDTKSTMVKIDKTTPATTVDLTGTLGNDGWYLSSVTVTLGASDATSGILQIEYSFDDTTWIVYTTPFIIDAEGTTTVYIRSTDNAGNVETGTLDVKIDKTPPDLTKSLSGTLGNNDWYVSDVTVTLSGGDSVSGLDSIQYSFDGTMWYTYSTPFVTNTEGITALYHKAHDVAGNEFVLPSQQIKIDKTPPTITGAATTPPNPHGWYNTDVTVQFTASDSLSGVDYVTPDQIISTEGSDQSTTGTATDLAGNSATYTVSGINIDETPPTITGAPTDPANSYGWYNVDVIIHFTASDSLSGVDAVTPDQTISSEGADQSITGYATDRAGNTASHTVAGINIDRTLPTITGAPTTPANVYGWYNTDVVVHFEATDSLSGINSITPDQTLSAEGADQSVTGTATDKAGNTASYTVSGINIDKTPPIITGDPTTPANSYGWYNTDVTVHFDATDAFSGIATITPDQTLTSEGAGQSVTGTATDKAGNSASYTVSGINIDKTAPTITGAPTTPANAHGWYNSDVTIHFEATDALSGIETITPDTTLSVEGASQSVTGYATDMAGNTAPSTVSGINIDETPPTITGAPTTSASAHGWYKADVIVHFEASDSLSGLDSVTPDQTLTAEGAGHSVIGTAVDKAGNPASCTVDGINIDKTPPVITGAPTTPANAYDWYNTDVTVHFEASDSLSGLLTVTPDTTLSAEGADQSVTGTAVDLAENEASCTVSGINIDKTPPTIMGAPTTSPNAYGWYNHDVTVHFTGSDALSGLDTVTPDQILSGEGADQSMTGVAVDKAGNSASCTVGGINIDKTTPATSLTIGEPKFGTAPTYVSTSTDFTLDAADAISEVDYTEYKIDAGAWTTYSTPFNVLDFDSHTIYYRSVDIAGNVEDTQSLWIVVNAASISYCGDLTDQYSDEATVEAMLVDMATQLSIADKIITFDIGSQSATAVTDISGVATASIVLDQPAGLYTVSAAFSGDTEYLACSDSQTFAITRENAEPEYTGDTVVPTTARSINLRATIFDSPDGFWGDLAKIQVTFNIYAGQLGSTPFMTIPAVPVTQTDTPGVGVAVATIDILPENGYLIIVSIDGNDYYEGPTSDATPLTVYEPTGNFVTGGGWIWDPSGSKGNFGFNVKYTKSGRPKGHSTYVYREDGWNIIVKSNAWIGMAIDKNHAFFETKCVVQMYNPATGELVWAEGNYKFRVDVWDNDSDGGVDIYQIRVLDKNGVLFHEAGFTPMGYLQGGNIVIHDEKKKHP